MQNEGNQLIELGTVTIPGDENFDFRAFARDAVSGSPTDRKLPPEDRTIEQLVCGENLTIKLAATSAGTKVTILGPENAALLDVEALAKVEETLRRIQRQGSVDGRVFYDI